MSRKPWEVIGPKDYEKELNRRCPSWSKPSTIPEDSKELESEFGEDKCEITCLTCGNKFSVQNGEEEVNWKCPVCKLNKLLRRCQKAFKAMRYVDKYNLLYGSDDSIEQIEADIAEELKDE